MNYIKTKITLAAFAAVNLIILLAPNASAQQPGTPKIRKGNIGGYMILERVAREHVVVNGVAVVLGARKTRPLEQGTQATTHLLIGAAHHKARLRNVHVRCDQSEVEGRQNGWHNHCQKKQAVNSGQAFFQSPTPGAGGGL